MFNRCPANRNDVTSIPVIGCLRLRSLIQVDFRDPSFTVPNTFLWSSLEPPFAIICSSLPFIKSFIAEFAPTFITKRNSSRSKGSSFKAVWCKPHGGHQKAFHRLKESVYSLRATKANVPVNAIATGDGPNDQHHYNEADVAKDTHFSGI